jgi:hypothetical protein
MQLGAVISQDNRWMAFFSQKLSKMQKNTVYRVTEIKVLAIVETQRNARECCEGNPSKFIKTIGISQEMP